MFRPRSKSRIIASSVPFITGRAAGIIFFVTCVGLIGVSVLNPQMAENMRLGIAGALSPAVKAISAPLQSAVLVTRDMTGISMLQAENIRLTEENARLREWYQAALVMESENKALHTLLNVKEDPQQTFITARIIADSANRFVRTMLVPAGSADGVKKGQAVLAGGGLIGRIIEVGDNVSRILLLTDINSKIPVLISGTNQHAIASGDNLDSLTLEYLDKDSPVEPGMRIITSGHAGAFPPGLAVGEISSVEHGKPHVKLFSDLNRIVYVRIVDFPQSTSLQKIVDAP